MAGFLRDLTTNRLHLEPLGPDTIAPEDFYEHVRVGAPGIDEITAHVTWEPYEDLRQAVDWIRECAEAFAAGEDATYVVRPRVGERAGEFAGIVALHPDFERRLGTIGAWFREPCWGRGYFGEAAAALLDVAFEGIGLEVVAITHAPENERSRRAIEKLVDRFGGRQEGVIRNDVVVGGEPRDSVRYSIGRAEWESNRG